MGVDIPDEQIDDFGDKDYILERIVKELNIQFNTRKRLLLKAQYEFHVRSDFEKIFSMFFAKDTQHPYSNCTIAKQEKNRFKKFRSVIIAISKFFSRKFVDIYNLSSYTIIIRREEI